jgi:hypothetical protein
MNIKNFNFHWFGYWKEYGESYKKFPSIKDFVDIERNKQYDKIKLLEYLRKGKVIGTTSGVNFIHPFDGEHLSGSISELTDGHFIWMSDLVIYIEHYNLTIPEVWLSFIKKNDYKMDKLDEFDAVDRCINKVNNELINMF